jgi:hypothetical protein
MKPKTPQTQSESGVADDLLREVWRIKDELSASYGHDLNRLLAEAREHQRKSGRPSVNLQTRGHAVKR